MLREKHNGTPDTTGITIAIYLKNVNHSKQAPGTHSVGFGRDKRCVNCLWLYDWKYRMGNCQRGACFWRHHVTCSAKTERMILSELGYYPAFPSLREAAFLQFYPSLSLSQSRVVSWAESNPFFSVQTMLQSKSPIADKVFWLMVGPRSLGMRIWKTVRSKMK